MVVGGLEVAKCKFALWRGGWANWPTLTAHHCARKRKFKNVINQSIPEMNVVCCKLWETGSWR